MLGRDWTTTRTPPEKHSIKTGGRINNKHVIPRAVLSPPTNVSANAIRIGDVAMDKSVMTVQLLALHISTRLTIQIPNFDLKAK